MQISIADLLFQVSEPPSGVEYLPEFRYRSFVLPASLNSADMSADIIVRVMTDRIEPVLPLQIIFDSGESWQLYRSEDFFYLTFQPGKARDLYWMARINFDFSRVDLRFNDQADFVLTGVVQKMLEYPIRYPLDQVLLMHHMARRKKGLLIHSAGMVLEKKGYIFPGISTAGKTTVSRQFMERGRGEILSDDRMIVRKIDSTFHAYGTPWPGDAGIAVNKGVPLSGLFFIHHSDRNRVDPLAPNEAVERLMPVSSIPWYDKEAVINLLDFCEDLASSVPVYDLYFKPTTEVVDFFLERTQS